MTTTEVERPTKKKLKRYGDRAAQLKDNLRNERSSTVLKNLRGDRPMTPGHGPLNPQLLIVGPVASLSMVSLRDAMHHNSMGDVRAYYTGLMKFDPLTSPKEHELDAARKYLFREIEILQPSVIVALGQGGITAMDVGTSITSSHGNVYTHEDGTPVVACVHPRMVLADPKMMMPLMNDMAIVRGTLRKVLRNG